MQTKTIKIDSAEATEIQEWLTSCKPVSDYGECDTIKTYTVKFDDNIEADIKVVNGDDGPYIDAVWFDDGCEIGFLEPFYTFLGEYYFFDKYESQEYMVVVQTA